MNRAARWAVLSLLTVPACAVLARPPAPSASAPVPFVARGTELPFDPAKVGPAVKRCGWWDNATPGNVWLTDRDGEWTVAQQGLYEAVGDGPDFKRGQQAPLDAVHGHGCACMMVRADPESKFVLSIADAKALPLKTCRSDPKLEGKEPRPR
jgi:hypothetical protein